MPDFQFSEENPPATAPPPTGETPPAPPSPPPAKTSGFQFSAAETAAPPQKITPAAPIPAAPIPGPPIPTALIPGPPIPKLEAPPTIPVAPKIAPKIAAPAAPTPQVPVPARPANAPVANAPAVNAPVDSAPVGNAPVGNAPVGSARPASAPVQNPTPRAAPVPIAVPSPSVSVASPSIEQDEIAGAPQDDFSRKIWDVGQKIKVALDALEGPASWLLRVSVVIGVCALAYILAATLLGGAGNPANPKMADLTKNLDLASRAFVLSLIAASVASLILGYEDNRLGAIVCGLGLVFHFVMPIVLKNFVGDTRAISTMAAHFQFGGYVLVMVGLAKAVCDTAIWLWNLPERMKSFHANVGVSNQAEAKQRIIARQANMLSPCWKLPFCRESIRKQCPAFLAKTTCWKFGRGCYCDTEMISRIVRGESLELITAPTQQSRQGKPPCGRCYIYLEHQTYKFRVLSPLALPVSVITTWLVWPIYTRIFSIGNKAFDSIWTSLSFDSSKLTPKDLQTSSDMMEKVTQVGNSAEEIAFIAQNMFGVLLGFMLLIYISKFIEWAIYKAKW